MTSPASRRLYAMGLGRQSAFSLVAICLIVVACIGGERLEGPTLRVTNDSGEERIVRVAKDTWSIAADDTGLIRLPITYLNQEVVFEILDDSCTLLARLPIQFGQGTDADAAVDLTQSGAGAPRTATIDDIQSILETARVDAERCR